jgi:hypothetical protein
MFIRLLFIQFIVPIVQLTLFCLCIGRPPKHLSIGVINNDNQSISIELLKNMDSGRFIQVMKKTLKALITQFYELLLLNRIITTSSIKLMKT